MCGIVFKFNFDKKKPVNNYILQQYDKQRSRGTQGFGLFDGQFMKIVRESKEDNILKWLCKKDSNLIMFHHRFPTSTINVAKAAHPFSTHEFFGDTQYIMVHNGIIRNADDLWVKHQEMGIRYTSLLDDLSFNDSEALLWDLALTMEGKQEKVTATGDMAFICMKTVKGKLVDMRYGRNDRPLMIKRTKESIEISSEGEGVSIIPNTLYNYNFLKGETTKEDMEFPQYVPFRSSKRWDFGNSYTRAGQTHLALPSATHEGHDSYDSYDEYYRTKYGYGQVPADSSVKLLSLSDKEQNWQRLREKYGSKSIITATNENAEELSKNIAEVLHAEALDSTSAKSIEQILQTKRDKNGRFVVAEIKHEDVLIDLDSLSMRDYEPQITDVQNCAMEYMIEAQGNYEGAYELLELAYAEFLDEIADKATFDDIRQQLLMEKALEFINSDPEYENEESVSSIWQALWFQQQTVNAY